MGHSLMIRNIPTYGCAYNKNNAIGRMQAQNRLYLTIQNQRD